MKKRKILFLFPLAALILSGCTFQEGFESVKNFMGDKVVDPIKDLIPGAKKDEEQKEEKEDKDEQPSGDQTPDTPETPETPEKQLESIEISGQFKNEYEIGEEFDKTGVVVTAVYDNGDKEDVSSQAQFSALDSSKRGPASVTVSFNGKSAEISVTIVKTRWTAAEKALFNEHLYGIELPFFEVEGATISFDAQGAQLRMFDEAGKALSVERTQIADYAAKFSSSDGWDNVSSDYSAYQSAPAGSFFVFEKSAQTASGMRRISVQFYGFSGSSYATSGSFAFYASDPFNYTFPADELAAEFNNLSLTPFTIPAPEGDGLYFEFVANKNNSAYMDYVEEYGYDYMRDYIYSRIYIYGLDAAAFETYCGQFTSAGWTLTPGEGANDWDFYASKTIEEAGVANIKLGFTDNYVAIHIEHLLGPIPAKEWPAEDIAALFEANQADLYEFPAFSGEDVTFLAKEYLLYGMFPYGVDVYVYGATEEEIDTFMTVTLPGAGWEVNEAKTMASKVFESLNGVANVQFILEDGVLDIYLPYGLSQIPAAEFPSEDLADAFEQLGVTPFTIPGPEGEGFSYEYEFDDYNLSCVDDPDYCYDYLYINNMSSEQFSGYVTQLSEAGWTYTEDDGDYTFTKEFGEKLAKFMMWHTESETYGNYATLKIFYVMGNAPLKAWPSDLISSAFEAAEETPFAIPALEGDGFRFVFNDQYVQSYKIAAIYVSGTVTADDVDDYADAFELAGWTVTSSSGVYTAKLETANGFQKVEFSFDEDEGEALIYLYLALDPLPKAEWPAEDIAAYFDSEITDVVPEYKGENSGFAFFEAGYVVVSVEEGTEEAAVAAYVTSLLEDYHWTVYDEGYYASPNNQIVVSPYSAETGSFTIVLYESPTRPGFINRRFDAYLEGKGLTGYDLPDFSSLEAVYAGASYSNVIYLEGDQVATVLALLDGWDIPDEPSATYGYECYASDNDDVEIDVKYIEGDNETKVSLYYWG